MRRSGALGHASAGCDGGTWRGLFVVLVLTAGGVQPGWAGVLCAQFSHGPLAEVRQVTEHGDLRVVFAPSADLAEQGGGLARDLAMPAHWGVSRAQGPVHARAVTERMAALVGNAPDPSRLPLWQVALAPDQPPDRWGRIRADLVWQGQSLTRHLIEAGLVLADPSVLPANCRIRVLQAEEEARRHGRGMWGDPRQGLLRPTDLAQAMARAGRVAVLEGVVTHVGQGRRSAFIDFGPRGQAVSIEVPLPIWRGLPLPWTAQALVGHGVRARGIVLARGTPRLLVASEASLELVR